MAISGKQIRAARALADMRQDELAQLVGLTPQAIRKIEDDAVQPREGTMADMVSVFTARGLEFIENQGVRFRPEGIQILSGREGLITLMDDIYDACRRGIAGDLILAGAPEDDFERILGDYDAVYLANMGSVPNLKMRTLIQEGDMNFVSGAYTEYRWAPKELFQPVPFYAYADKLAIIVFNTDPSPRIFMIQSKTIADAYRLQFEGMWKQSKPVPVKKGA
ncbi:MAG: helix-turn-helix transcriptional regulator [Alphaproteobacteria bacterium]|nr:helix-turn-helix transcriptional regulator [Alphaproteobacteria bacterium]